MSQISNKFLNLTKALQRLQEATQIARENNDALIRDGLIQRFEFTYELIWKVLKEYLEQNGIVDKHSPRMVFKEAYAQRLINNEQTWLSIIDDQNQTSHIYNEKVAIQIANRIINCYIQEFETLVQKLKNQ